jgi:hypothetical protein
MTISKKMTIKTMHKGSIINDKYIALAKITAQVKLIKIFKRICPDIMLANNLIDKLKTRDK